MNQVKRSRDGLFKYELDAMKKIANGFDNHMDAKRTLREIVKSSFFVIWSMKNIISIRNVVPPSLRRQFNDVYIATELMDTDPHQILRSNHRLSVLPLPASSRAEDFMPTPNTHDHIGLLLEISDANISCWNLRLEEMESLNQSKRRRSKKFPPRNERDVEKDSSDESMGDDHVQHMKSFTSGCIPRHAASFKVPRKARSACLKRSHRRSFLLGCSGGGFGVL